jgi:putative FmdB family regulatory protein
MPLYEYVCEDCGPFAAMRPLAAFADPCACPDCGAASPRNLLASPALGGSGSPASATPARAHPGGCGCCKPARGLRADAVGG